MGADAPALGQAACSRPDQWSLAGERACSPGLAAVTPAVARPGRARLLRAGQPGALVAGGPCSGEVLLWRAQLAPTTIVAHQLNFY
jgi:hypothetical protein